MFEVAFAFWIQGEGFDEGSCRFCGGEGGVQGGDAPCLPAVGRAGEGPHDRLMVLPKAKEDPFAAHVRDGFRCAEDGLGGKGGHGDGLMGG